MELGEAAGPQDLRDPQLGRPCLAVDRSLEPAAFGSQPYDAGPAVVRSRHARQVSVLFQVAEQIVDRLFCDPHVCSHLAGAQSVKARIPPEPDMRGVQIVVSRREDTCIHLIADPLPDDTQHGPDVPASLVSGDGPGRRIV